MKTYSAYDNIRMIQKFLSHTTCEELLSTETTELQHLILLLASPTTTDPSQTFTALFPDDDIYDFTDEEGRPLHGGRSMAFWNRYGRGSRAETLDRQRKWLRDRAIPACRTKLLGMIHGKAINEALCKEVCDLAFVIREIENRFE